MTATNDHSSSRHWSLVVGQHFSSQRPTPNAQRRSKATMRPLQLAALCLLLCGRATGDSGKLIVTVDPRIELLAAAMSQSEWPQGRAGFFSPYAREMQQAFFAHRDHAFVKSLNALR